MAKKKRAARTGFEEVFHGDLFNVLAPYLTTGVARKVRLLSRRSKGLVQSYGWRERTTLVTNVEKWRACFPLATELSLSTRQLKKSRDYAGLKGVDGLTVLVHKDVPRRFLMFAAYTLNDIGIDYCHPQEENRAFIYLPIVHTFRGLVGDGCMPYFRNVQGAVCIQGSPITDFGLMWLHPLLKALNISGCSELTAEADISCFHLSCLNVSHTRISDRTIRDMPDTRSIEIVVFGFNPNVTDAALEPLTGLKKMYVYLESNPFSVAACAALQRRGVEIGAVRD